MASQVVPLDLRKPLGVDNRRICEPRTLLVAGISDENQEYLNYLARAGYVIDVQPAQKGLQEHILRSVPNILILDMDSLGERALRITEALKENPMTFTMPITIIIGRKSLEGEIKALEAGAEDYLNKPFAPEILVARVETALRRNTRLQISNPLTGLPGSIYIEEQIMRRVDAGLPLAVCYADLDNFKAFNDKYGYARGDNIIRITATILNESVVMYGRKGDFVGHIGGDDFILVVDYHCADPICTYITNSFDTLIPFQYDEEDMAKGYIEAQSRQHQPVQFPIMTISIGVVTNQYRRLDNFLKISELSAEMKEYAKSISKDQTVRKSSFRIDQRTG